MSRNSLRYVLAGAGAGLLAGFLGVGGGPVLVLIMVAVFSFSQHRAHGTSLAIIIPTALTSAILYALRGDVDWTLVAAVGSGSLVGVVAGAKLMMRVSPRRLRQVFGVFAMGTAITLLLL